MVAARHWELMRHNDRRGVELDRLLEHLADPDHGGIQAAAIDRVELEDAILGIEQNDAQLFLIKMAHFSDQERGDVSG